MMPAGPPRLIRFRMVCYALTVSLGLCLAPTPRVYALGVTRLEVIEPNDSGKGLLGPMALIYDRRRDRLVVADTENNRVLLVDRAGTVVKNIGNKGELDLPVALALSRKGTLYVAERGKPDLKRFTDYDALGDAHFDIARWPEGAGRRSPAPVALFVDAQQQLYVADRANHQLLACRDDLSVTRRFSNIWDPVALWVSGRELYVGDAGSGGVRVFSVTGAVKMSLGTQSTGFSVPLRPKAVTVDRRQRIWVIDEQDALYALNRNGHVLYRSEPQLFFQGADLVSDEFDNLIVLEKGANRMVVFKIND